MSYLKKYGFWSDDDKANILENHITTYHKRKEKWTFEEVVSPLLFFRTWEEELTITNINLAIEKLKNPYLFLNLKDNGIELSFNEMSLFINKEEEVSKTRTVLKAILQFKQQNN